MNKLLIAGTMAFDSIESPFGKVSRILGGSATYIALAASNQEIECSVISVVGNDFSEANKKKLTDRSILIEGVQQLADKKTFFWSGKYENDLNTRETLVTELNALEDFNPVVSDKNKSPDFLMLGNLHPEVQLSVINQLTKKPKLIALDTMNFWMDHTWDALIQVIKKVDIIIINEEEARQLSKEYSLVKAAEVIQRYGPKFVIIKKGEHGALLFSDKKVFFAPALPLEVVFDPTGAGDVFAGGFMGFLTRSGDISFENLKRAVVYGSSIASFCVEKFGTERLESLTQKEVINRLLEFKQLSQFDIELA